MADTFYVEAVYELSCFIIALTRCKGNKRLAEGLDFLSKLGSMESIYA
jgi:hypothetical protein